MRFAYLRYQEWLPSSLQFYLCLNANYPFVNWFTVSYKTQTTTTISAQRLCSILTHAVNFMCIQNCSLELSSVIHYPSSACKTSWNPIVAIHAKSCTCTRLHTHHCFGLRCLVNYARRPCVHCDIILIGCGCTPNAWSTVYLVCVCSNDLVLGMLNKCASTRDNGGIKCAMLVPTLWPRATGTL